MITREAYLGRIFAVKVAARYDIARVGEYQWIVRGTVHFSRDHVLHEFNRVPRDAVDLRNNEGVRVATRSRRTCGMQRIE